MTKARTKDIISFLFRFSGLPFLIREVLCRNKVTILCYHTPSAEAFTIHLEYLRQRYHFISLQRLVDAICNRDWSDIPPKSLVITIDDGCKENYALLEIFKEYSVWPTIFLCSHIINTGRRFWFETGCEGIQALKRCGSHQRLKSLRDTAGYEPQKEYPDRQALKLDEINEMSARVDFQSHSKFHPVLTTCTDEECKEEIAGSKHYLESLLRKRIDHYSYPNGDYSEREVTYVKRCGYKSARTLDIGWNDVNTDPFRLKAMGVGDAVSVNILCAQMTGFFPYLRYAQHGSLNGKHPAFV